VVYGLLSGEDHGSAARDIGFRDVKDCAFWLIPTRVCPRSSTTHTLLRRVSVLARDLSQLFLRARATVAGRPRLPLITECIIATLFRLTDVSQKNFAPPPCGARGAQRADWLLTGNEYKCVNVLLMVTGS